VIEETPQFQRKSPISPRNLRRDDDSRSLDSNASSLDNNVISNGNCADNSTSTTITVTAEINAIDCRDEIIEETITIQDPYAGLSYEDRLQIIRLSYEDLDMSRCSPDPQQQPRSKSQMTTNSDNDHQQIDDRKILLSKGDTVSSSHVENAYFATSDNICHLNIHEDDELLSTGDSTGQSSVESTNRNTTNRFPIIITNQNHASKIIRLSSLTSPSGSSMDASTSSESSSDHPISSPEQSKRDSGYDGKTTNGDEDVEKAQYEKLLYFQRQLAKQHEELARLGIHVPLPKQKNQAETTKSQRPQNGQYTSA